eukprot:3983734-Pleurochrysis_carterae.AAC.1
MTEILRITLCVTLPRPAMDALMRSRDVAAQHAHAEADTQRSRTDASAESNAADLLAAQELRF